MARTTIRVGLLASTQFIADTMPIPKVKDMETGEIATDRDTGEELYTVQLFLMEEGRAETLKVTVPESGKTGVAPGMPVRPVDLFASPWARVFNGQLSDGVAYRATRLEVVQPVAQTETGQ